MRKLIVSNLISLDGYASSPGGDVMALPFDATFSDYNLELMQAADTLVSGATTYDLPRVRELLASSRRRPSSARSRAGHLAPPPRARAPRRLRQSERGRDRAVGTRPGSCVGTRHGTRSPQAKKDKGGPLVAFGSMTTWNDLLAAGLVDELHMMVGAGVLVEGVPAFSVGHPARCG